MHVSMRTARLDGPHVRVLKRHPYARAVKTGLMNGYSGSEYRPLVTYADVVAEVWAFVCSVRMLAF